MNPTTEERVEIKAGAFSLTVSFTPEGLEVVRAMVGLLEAELGVVAPIEKPAMGEQEPPQNPTAPPISPVQPSYSSRLKYPNWNAVGRSRTGLIYKEVVDRFLDEYKKGVEPSFETLSKIIQEMYYRAHLKESSIATYVGIYRSYIRKNKLAVTPSPLPQQAFKPKGKELLPMEKVVEVWDMLPSKFVYKNVKALVPPSIMQSEGRVAATNYIIKQFLGIPEFGCEEPSPGVFVKRGGGEK